MFGYVKPDKKNLLVKDLELYKATYCGLCSVIKKRVSFILPFVLNYDFVFLAMVRTALSGEKSCISKGRCKYNPLKKCVFSVCDTQTLYTSRSALILTALKLEDDLKDKDTPLYKKLIARPLYWHFSACIKKLTGECEEYGKLITDVRRNLERLSALEKEGSAEIDVACEIFGDVMADIASFGLENGEKAVAKEIGSAVGRYIYLADAIDDAEKDAKSGVYNPLIAKYGSVTAVKEQYNELDVALAMFAQRALLATNLMNECEYTRIIDNIIRLGLGAEAYKIMTRNGDKND